MNLSEPEIWPYLANALGLEQADQTFEARLALLDRTMLQQQTHVALRQLFMTEAQQAPVIFIFEDLQWLDPASSKFLEYLIQTTDDTPMMLVLESRLTEPDGTLNSLQSVLEKETDHLVDLQLGPLSVTEQELLVDQFINQNTTEGQRVRQKIIQRGGGECHFTWVN